ncbi:Ubiquitin carboxyl-terminal hydrolase, putative isoform 1 [Hibiscus syriacus]|uniref:Ubiquitin carboxyl-terminal hydrolase, putative isoform 1 n=2 Tax=Hibiscus syriacus TaxID=106335 RepID=A0A6A2ZCG1_HIBSY|nr:Ubiquitin carboxyl-terminal hydrolase, putative isoform 1 [Hibiscus syriacus]
MARVPCKHLILVAFSLFFIATTATARNMPVAKETQKVLHVDQVLTATENHGEDHAKVDELVAMDYSPATRKPPIHN